MMGFHHQSAEGVPCPFARHLATEVVELLQRVADGAVELAHFLQAGHMLYGGRLVLTGFKGLKVQLAYLAHLGLYLVLHLGGDAVGYDEKTEI